MLNCLDPDQALPIVLSGPVKDPNILQCISADVTSWIEAPNLNFSKFCRYKELC